MIGTDGSLVNSYRYDEWGNLTQQKETVTNEFKYAGETYDAETGLYYLKARYYDPSTGRFLNEDTYEGKIDNPVTLNIYSYVMNNPLNYIDPTGHESGAVTYQTANQLKEDKTTTKQFAGVIKVMVDFWILNDIDTLIDPNSSELAKGFATAGLIPVSKVVKGGKLIVNLVNDAGNKIQKEYKLYKLT